MTANTIIAERLHSAAENIATYCLNDILHKFRAVAFDSLPLFSTSDTLISDRLAAELILTDTGFNIRKPSAPRQRDEQHSALIFKLNAMCICAKPLSYCILHAAVDFPPEPNYIRVGVSPHIHERLKFIFGKSHLQCAHSFQSADRTTVAESQFCNFTFLPQMSIDTVLFDRYTKHLTC